MALLLLSTYIGWAWLIGFVVVMTLVVWACWGDDPWQN